MKRSKTAEGFAVFLKGLVMGTANVIPGVSGGTFAIILGILERLVDAIKSFNKQALALLIKGKLKELIAHVDLIFLIEIFAGMVFAIFSLAKLLEFLFAKYPEFVWAFFFGLIVASVYYVGRRVKNWGVTTVIAFIIGTGVAVGISFISPAVQNDSLPYVFLCGMLAISAMILPGVSGSFILILLGNYELIVIDAIGNLRFEILIPFAAGCGIGLLAFSYLLSFVLKRFKDVTISTLTGFILGSLLVIWPWKEEIHLRDSLGELILKDGEPVLERYARIMPDSFDGEVIAAILLVLAGIALMWLAERNAHPEAPAEDPSS